MTKVVKAGFRTNLIVPMLKDNEVIGIIGLARKQAQPFTEQQIALCKDFAAQATIALESTRRERQYREMQLRAGARQPRRDDGPAHRFDCA